jgi:hypothetical protein
MLNDVVRTPCAGVIGGPGANVVMHRSRVIDVVELENIKLFECCPVG